MGRIMHLLALSQSTRTSGPRVDAATEARARARAGERAPRMRCGWEDKGRARDGERPGRDRVRESHIPAHVDCERENENENESYHRRDRHTIVHPHSKLQRSSPPLHLLETSSSATAPFTHVSPPRPPPAPLRSPLDSLNDSLQWLSRSVLCKGQTRKRRARRRGQGTPVTATFPEASFSFQYMIPIPFPFPFPFLGPVQCRKRCSHSLSHAAAGCSILRLSRFFLVPPSVRLRVLLGAYNSIDAAS